MLTSGKMGAHCWNDNLARKGTERSGQAQTSFCKEGTLSCAPVSLPCLCKAEWSKGVLFLKRLSANICFLLSSYSPWVALKRSYCSSHSPLSSFQPDSRPQDPAVLAAVPRTHHPKGRVTTMQQPCLKLRQPQGCSQTWSAAQLEPFWCWSRWGEDKVQKKMEEAWGREKLGLDQMQRATQEFKGHKEKQRGWCWEKAGEFRHWNSRRKRPFIGHNLMSAGDFFQGWREDVSSLLLPWAQSLCFKPSCRQLRLCCPQRAALPVCTVLAQPPGTN